MKDSLRKIELHMVATFTVISAIISIGIMIVLTNRANQNLRNYVSNLIAANGRQIELNIDRYLKKIEEDSSVFFAEDAYVNYNKADTNLEEYEQIQLENEIQEKIINLGLMENFTDFAIVYSDDSNIGWISKNTSKTFSSGGIYDFFSQGLDDQISSDWSYLVMVDISRIYYTKRLNDHAIILVSFYATELDDCFVIPEKFKDMTIRLVMENDEIVYSTDNEEIGSALPNEVESMLSNEKTDAQIFMNNDTLMTEHSCSNGWKVICSIPMDALMRENTSALRRSTITVVILAIFEMLLGYLIYMFYSHKMNRIVTEIKTQADQDQMTGLLNKTTFQKTVKDELHQYITYKAFSFIMLDIDYFKQINDKYGHARGDQVIIQLANLLATTFPENYKLGRIGGDEFAIFASYDKENPDEVRNQLKELIDSVYQKLPSLTRRDSDDRISISCGIVVTDSSIYTYDNLYQRADAMLYRAKQRGKGQACFEDEA